MFPRSDASFDADGCYVMHVLSLEYTVEGGVANGRRTCEDGGQCQESGNCTLF